MKFPDYAVVGAGRSGELYLHKWGRLTLSRTARYVTGRGRPGLASRVLKGKHMHSLELR